MPVAAASAMDVSGGQVAASSSSVVEVLNDDDLDAYSEAGMSVVHERPKRRFSPYASSEEIARRKRYARNWNCT